MITRKSTEFSEIDFSEGAVILIDKETGWTSFDVVNKIRKFLKVKKVGHAGTLDPAATGLLVVCTGKKTKSIPSYQDLKKSYKGIITLGKTTPSMDGETPFVEENDIGNVTEESITVVKDSFVGDILQIPPMFSALKHKGKPLYKYARKGQEVKRESRNVTVYKFDITRIELPDIYFEIEVSKGTYIRVIAYDLGKKLGCGAYLKTLRRTSIGNLWVDDALKINEFEELVPLLKENNERI